MLSRLCVDSIVSYFDGHVIASSFSPRVHSFKGPLFLSDDTMPRDGFIYIGTTASVKEALQSNHNLANCLWLISVSDKRESICFTDDYEYVCIDMPVIDLYNKFTEYLVIQSEEMQRQDLNEKNIYSILTGRIKSPQLLRKLLDPIMKGRKHYSVEIIYSEIKLSGDALRECAWQLKKILSDSFFVYLKDIVILISPQQKQYSSFDQATIQSCEEILNANNCYMVISNTFSEYGMLDKTYSFVLELCHIFKKIGWITQEKRAVFFKDYSIYYVLTLCERQYKTMYGNNDILYIGHPDIIKLRKYDKENNTDLFETLKQYLYHGENISKTAAKTFCHRNTVKNKLNKIESITGMPIAGGIDSFNLLFSCFLYEYFEYYLKGDVVFSFPDE